MAKVVCVEFRGVNDTFKMIGAAIGNMGDDENATASPQGNECPF